MQRGGQLDFTLEAMALEIPEVAEHPNRHPFRGVLTHLDVPSDVPPLGAEGHLVVLPSKVAGRALASLLGMAVNFAAGARGHDVRRKVGVITRADVIAGQLEVAGYLFAKDFPELIGEIRARRGDMGMSYEITDVLVEDVEAAVWVLNRVTFTGAAILERDAAAFKRTSLAATAGTQQGGVMDEKELKKSMFASIEEWFRSRFGGTPDPAAAFTEVDARRIAAEAVGSLKTELGAQLTALTEENKQLKAAQLTAVADARRARWNGALAAEQKAGKVVPALLENLQA